MSEKERKERRRRERKGKIGMYKNGRKEKKRKGL